MNDFLSFLKYSFGRRFHTQRFPHVYPKIPTILMVAVFCLAIACSQIERHAFPAARFSHGFALDSSGNLYIGEDTEICVLDPNGEYLHSVKIPASQGYTFTAFTVDSQDRILIHTGTEFCTLDLNRKTLKREEPTSAANIDLVFPKAVDTFVAPDNAVYQLKYRLFCPTIVRQGEETEIVYQISAPQFLLRIAKVLSFLSFGILALIVSWKSYQLNKKAMDEEEKRRDFKRARQ